MRRHAESLIVLAGDSPRRAFRDPVPFVDVLRAAAAEVEDYTRIKVISRTPAALAGPAVADVIHLLAEFVENATIFSPSNTEVRMTGDSVANGYAVDIEDRGQGMRDEQLAAVNASLADPPMFDLSGSDQLGLFVAARLARRHGIRVTLRPSGYGGVTAIVLIPRDLVVLADAIGPGAVPGRAPDGRLTAATEVRKAVPVPPGNGAHAAPDDTDPAWRTTRAGRERPAAAGPPGESGPAAAGRGGFARGRGRNRELPFAGDRAQRAVRIPAWLAARPIRGLRGTGPWHGFARGRGEPMTMSFGASWRGPRAPIATSTGSLTTW